MAGYVAQAVGAARLDRVGKGGTIAMPLKAPSGPPLPPLHTPYSGTATERGAERPIEGPDHRAGSDRDCSDHQEEIRLRHARPEAAEVAGHDVADEARRQPNAHHHGEIPRRRN